MRYPHRVACHLSDETHAAVLALATSRGIPVAEVVREAVAGSLWRPIETAPKDGTAILLFGGENDANHTPSVPHPLSGGPVVGLWSTYGWYEGGGEWITTFFDGGMATVAREEPTHWMPLPEPPA